VCSRVDIECAHGIDTPSPCGAHSLRLHFGPSKLVGPNPEQCEIALLKILLPRSCPSVKLLTPVSFPLPLERVDDWERIASRGDRPSHTTRSNARILGLTLTSLAHIKFADLPTTPTRNPAHEQTPIPNYLSPGTTSTQRALANHAHLCSPTIAQTHHFKPPTPRHKHSPTLR